MVDEPRGPIDSSRVPRFADVATFARLPRIDQVSRADIAVVGIPFDSGTSFRPGARFGPSHIRENSRLLRPYNPTQNVSPFSKAQVVDAGDIAVTPFDIAAAIDTIEAAARHFGQSDCRLVALGGDHTVALPLLRAVAAQHGPVTVVHFDAHLDTWDTYFDAPHTHGTPFRRASEEGLIDLERSVHVGIRGPLYSARDLDDDKLLGFLPLTCTDVETDGLSAVIARMHERIGGSGGSGGSGGIGGRGAVPIYVSVDVDVLDPGFAPGTGTPEAGGLSSRELLAMVRTLSRHLIVGADVVEVAPAYDHAGITGIAAAHIAYELISAMVLTPPNGT
ncbi:agmatinase [Hoyosella rhizosphaerae]|uniref:Agmatinase n=1 Tax=Hoyosella rhizosphaerae TaxID=1755582 RepID=A0A916UJA1_9ACTN|nr:agmatinase [Hoyosella rhizosphaerae]MBN4925390.1 agmatinase [Hoyosella rhizosphaerae]GGC75599.1 agmatinase [Hoyosella rhizosphaerae]